MKLNTAAVGGNGSRIRGDCPTSTVATSATEEAFDFDSIGPLREEAMMAEVEALAELAKPDC